MGVCLCRADPLPELEFREGQRHRRDERAWLAVRHSAHDPGQSS